MNIGIAGQDVPIHRSVFTSILGKKKEILINPRFSKGDIILNLP
jgi:hypothetical protein